MTNFERIKNMSVEEMANFLRDLVTERLTNIAIQKWLESEVENR